MAIGYCGYWLSIGDYVPQLYIEILISHYNLRHPSHPSSHTERDVRKGTRLKALPPDMFGGSLTTTHKVFGCLDGKTHGIL